jgi:hypothetical protein
MAQPLDRHTFRNHLQILMSLDRHELPPMSAEQWWHFRDDPVCVFLHGEDPLVDAIWAAVQKRAA